MSNIIKGIIATAIIGGSAYIVYKLIKGTNKVIDGVTELKEDIETIVTVNLTNCMKDINKNLEERNKKMEEKLLKRKK